MDNSRLTYRLIFLVIFYILFSPKTFAQLEAKNWYFGSYCAMKFENNGITKLYDSKKDYVNGGSCISDKNGNLLFYGGPNTNNVYQGILWNRNHDTLKNGTGFHISTSSSQCPLIIPQPGNPNIYYLFTVNNVFRPFPGFWFHIVDMSKDNNKGELIVMNQKICNNVTSQISATFHSNKKSVWIVVRDWNSNKFKSFLLSSSGLDTIPVLSSCGTIITGSYNNCYGQMKFSASGNKLANVISGDALVDICDFDNNTGIVSNGITLNNLKIHYQNATYGVEFSSNEKFLFISTINLPARIIQVDLSSDIENVIKNSAVAIRTNNYASRGNYYCLQIGLDKKIYVAHGYEYLGCINNPDEKGIACSYVDSAIKFSHRTGQSLPTFLQSYFFLPDIEIENTCKGDSSTFGLKDTTNIDSIYWSFGDNNNSRLFYPKYVYADTGTYDINAIIYYDNKGDTFERKIRISNYAYADFSIADSIQCLNLNEFYFYDSSTAIDGSMTYEWDFGDSTSSFQQNPIKSYLSADTFSVKLTVTSSYGCESSVSKNVAVFASPKSSFIINDSIQCFNENSFYFYDSSSISSGTLNQFWNFGDGITSTSINPIHQYVVSDSFDVTLIVNSDKNCSDTLQKQVIVFPSPVAKFYMNDSIQCMDGNSFLFFNQSAIRSGSLNYLWDLGETTSSNKNPAHTYSIFDTFTINLLTISNLGCRDSFDNKLLVHSSLKAEFSINDSSQCYNKNLFVFNFSKVPNFGKVEWNLGDSTISGDTSIIHAYKSSGIYPIHMIIENQQGCADTAIKAVTVYPSPIADFSINDSVQCFNEQQFVAYDSSLVVGDSISNYYWSIDSSSLPNQQIVTLPNLNPATWNLKLITQTSNGCSDSITKSLIVLPSPIAEFSINDSAQCYNDQNFIAYDSSQVTGDSITQRFWILNNDTFPNFHIFTFPNLLPTTHNLKLTTITTQGCIDFITKAITVHPSPIANFSINDSTQCLDSNSFDFTNLSSIESGTMNYQWIIEKDTLTQININTLTRKKWGKYPVKLIATSDQNCPDTSDQNIYVYPMPVAAFVYLNNCLEDTMWFYDSSMVDSGKITQWFWDFKNGNTSGSQNPFTIYYDTGQKSVTLVSTSDFGCASDTTQFIKIESKVSEPLLERATVIEDEHILVEWKKPLEGIPKTYQLERSDDGNWWDYLADEDQATFSFEDYMVYPDIQSYYYRLSVTDSCDFTGDYSNFGKSILLRVDTSGAYPKLSWSAYEEWSQGVAAYELQVKSIKSKGQSGDEYTPVAVISQSEIPNPQPEISCIDSMTKLQASSYCYRVIAFRNGDSLQSVSNVLCIPAEFRLFVPNSFSPNGDGINDIFLPKGIFVSEYNLQIFNRWGEKMFESSDINEGWEGKFKGEYCQLGAYYYQISVKGTNGKSKVKNGTIQLLK